jgi:predicted nucleic acid-binding protein
MIAILDTTIHVDILRGFPAAAKWITAQANQTFGITPIVYLEVVSGVQNKVAQQQALQWLSQFDMAYLMQADMDWAMQQLVRYKLSHNIGMMDCLIASVSQRMDVPLYTTNLKHFTPMLGGQAQKPY